MVLAKYGVSAYGFSIPTGQDSQRGDAPGDLDIVFWNCLVVFLASIGLVLTAENYHEFFTDTFRSYAAQEAVHDAKPSLAAEPGTSIHGIGYAVDWNNDRPDWHTIQNALRNTGSKYGLVHPFSDPTREDWHWQLIPGFVLEVPKMDFVLVKVFNDAQTSGCARKIVELGGAWVPNSIGDRTQRTAKFPKDNGEIFANWAKSAKLHGTLFPSNGNVVVF